MKAEPKTPATVVTYVIAGRDSQGERQVRVRALPYDPISGYPAVGCDVLTDTGGIDYALFLYPTEALDLAHALLRAISVWGSTNGNGEPP